MVQSSGQTYAVVVRADTVSQASAIARGHTLSLNIQKGGSLGFNAAETLLAALGTCILTNIESLSQKMRIEIQGARMELTAERSDDPPGLTRIDYRLVLQSGADKDKLEHLHHLAVRWGTVTNTLARGIVPTGDLIVEQ